MCKQNSVKPRLRVSLIMLIPVLLLLVFSGCLQNLGTSNETGKQISENQIAFNDTMGNKVVLSHPAERIIVSANDIAEMFIAIGAGDKIVGIADKTTLQRYILDNLQSDVKDVGGWRTPDIEVVSQLKPDVFVSFEYSRPLNIDKLLALNATVVYFNCEKFEELNDEAYAIGEMTGNQEGAQKYIQFNKKYQELVESRLANLTPDEIPTVYGETLGEYNVMTRIHCGGHVINALHAQNVFGNRTDLYSPQLATDWVPTKDPDVIIKMGRPWGDGAIPFSSVYEKITNRTGYKDLKAVRSNRVFIIESKLVSTPHSVVGLVYLAKALYPDRFDDINPDEIWEEYKREFHFENYPQVERIYPPFEPVNASGIAVTSTTHQ